MARVYNFSAGPGVLPEETLATVARDMLDWSGSGMSVAEMSHRGEHFMEIATQARERLRRLMQVRDTHHILFLQGGATLQFSAIPMNLLRGKRRAAYINTGSWSEKAIKAAGKYCTVDVIASGKNSNFTAVPELANLAVEGEHAYLHYTPNETIGGVRIGDVPQTNVPLVADMSSMILSETIDVSRFGLIYAGAQKNIGPAGLAIVIVRKDLCGEALPITPDVIEYAQMAKHDSMLNTPPTFSWYIAGLVFEWIEEQGGVTEMERRAIERSTLLYDAIDNSKLYRNPIVLKDRSRMNIPFLLRDESLNDTFLSEAKARGLVNLEGHRSVGGMRASLYNAMPLAGVRALITFMLEFEKAHL
ncbi:3-phosphoserine/phosphohydroxythreonine transaminase [Candidatus Kaiserbacteria bacterium]|nr:3-phosphoserine/phosphohydroxythreonine transaminase [Candidatus Kaiserbacteria bacterium]